MPDWSYPRSWSVGCEDPRGNHLCGGSLRFLIRFRTLHYRISRRRHRSRRCVFKQVKLAVHERARFRGRAQPDAIDIPRYGPARSCRL